MHNKADLTADFTDWISIVPSNLMEEVIPNLKAFYEIPKALHRHGIVEQRERFRYKCINMANKRA